METLWKNLVYSVRMLLKRPSLTIVAIVAIGLGIGANTAIFSVVNTVLLRPLPFEQPERLVMVSTEQRNPSETVRMRFSIPSSSSTFFNSCAASSSLPGGFVGIDANQILQQLHSLVPRRGPINVISLTN